MAKGKFKRALVRSKARFARKRMRMTLSRPRRANLRIKTQAKVGRGLPYKVVQTMKYAENVNLTSTAGALATYQFSCNGLFDPNITGTGHQPMYFDQMSALYNHYHVIGSKATVKIIPGTANEDQYHLAFYKDDDTTVTPASVITLSEINDARIKFVAPNDNRMHFMSQKWSAKKTFGGSIMANDSLKGTPAANPAEQTYFTLALQAGGATTVALNVLWEIEYIVVWNELKQIAGS